MSTRMKDVNEIEKVLTLDEINDCLDTIDSYYKRLESMENEDVMVNIFAAVGVLFGGVTFGTSAAIGFALMAKTNHTAKLIKETIKMMKILRDMSVYLNMHDEYRGAKCTLILTEATIKTSRFKEEEIIFPRTIKNVKYIKGAKPNLEVPSVSRSLGERNYTMTYNLKQLSKLYSKLNSVNSRSGEAKMLNAYLYSIGKGFEGDEDTASCVTDESDCLFYRGLIKFRSKVKEYVEVLEDNSEYDLVEFKIKTDKYSVFIGETTYIYCEVPMYFEFNKIHGGHGWTHI